MTDGSGDQIHALIARLYPIGRSITGAGVRKTFDILRELIPLETCEVPTGTQAYDWAVPKEWNIREAWIRGPDGQKVVDFSEHNLHVMGYSVPVHTRMPLAELKNRIHTLPEHPHWIPYRTSYYREDWGFCVPHARFESWPDGEYEVFIDATLEDGSLTYAELLLPGQTERDVLFFAHSCHPSLCNDNLSGLSVLTFLARWLSDRPRRLNYRFVFAPATIGSITWLSRNEEILPRIKYGLVASLLGDAGHFTYKRTRAGEASVDRAMIQVLEDRSTAFDVVDFLPWGYDERQFCSPGIDLPVGRLTRTPNGKFSEYHTSADDLEFVRPESLAESLDVLKRFVEVIESDRVYVNSAPKGEPQLGKRGLYGSVGGYQNIETDRLALLWVLNLSDGRYSLRDIVTRSGLSHDAIDRAAEVLHQKGLLRET